MAVSEIDKQLIDKQIEGSLTAKEHAMWSKRMQDQGFLQAWHQAQDMQMRSSQSVSAPSRSSRQKPPGSATKRPGKNVIWLVAISILIIMIVIFLVWDSV